MPPSRRIQVVYQAVLVGFGWIDWAILSGLPLGGQFGLGRYVYTSPSGAQIIFSEICLTQSDCVTTHGVCYYLGNDVVERPATILLGIIGPDILGLGKQ